MTATGLPKATNLFLRKAHRCNAIFLSAFIMLHMVTHLSGAFGVEAYNAVQDTFRTVYRHPVVETPLLISITAQLVIGAYLLVHRIRRDGVSCFWGWLQIVSGAFFFVFMAQHLYSLGMARLYFRLDTNFYWPASVMSGPWFIYYFAPYYILGVFALFTHVGTGLRFALIDRGAPELGRRVGILTIAVGALVSLAIPPIIAGVFFPIELPQEWVDYLRFYMPSFKPYSAVT